VGATVSRVNNCIGISEQIDGVRGSFAILLANEPAGQATEFSRVKGSLRRCAPLTRSMLRPS
jgi:hypothetical protein